MILPEGFEKLFKESLGNDAFERYSSAISVNANTSVRINPLKFSEKELLALWPDAIPVPWCRNAFYLPERPNFTLDPLFHAGAYYVQDASSMFLDAVIRQIFRNDDAGKFNDSLQNPVFSGPAHVTPSDTCHALETDCIPTKRMRVLDLCAAPGGKSTHLLSLLGHDSLLVSNEVISSRATILKENLAVWGGANAVVTSSDSEIFAAKLPEFFDIVLVDAPCSGEGMFRKLNNASGNAAIDNWSLENVKLCAARQQRILSSAIKCLKPGGWLIYSTCTYNHFENDDQLAFLKSEFGLDVLTVEPFDALAGISSSTASVSAASSASAPDSVPATNFAPVPASGTISDSAHATTSDSDHASTSHTHTNSNNTSAHHSPILIKTPNGGYQFVPGLVSGEGQFCALLQLPSSKYFPLGDSSTTMPLGSVGTSASDDPAGGKNVLFEKDLPCTQSGRAHRSDDFQRGFSRNKAGMGVNTNGKFSKSCGRTESKYERNTARIKTPEAIASLVDAMNRTCSGMIVRQHGDLFKVMPEHLLPDIDCVASAVRVLGSGMALGSVKGKDFIPDAELATSELLVQDSDSYSENANIDAPYIIKCGGNSCNAFKMYEVDRETALKFLAKQLNALENAPLGILLLSYRGKNLGFVKNLGRRVNNLLPNARRILNL